jgi:predicted RNA-binding protein with PUA domain
MHVSVCLEIVLILTQDRCTVCAEHTIRLKIIFDPLDGTPR